MRARAASPNAPDATVAMSVFAMTAAAGKTSRSPPAVSMTTPDARPFVTRTSRTRDSDAERDAEVLRELGHRAREPRHSTVDHRDALALDVRDQVERGGRLERGGADVGRVPREERPEPFVGERRGDGAPHRAVRVDLPDAAEAEPRARADQAGDGRSLGLQERRAHRLGDRPTVRGKASIGSGLSRTGERSDRVRRAVQLREEIERRALAPGVTRDDGRRYERHGVVEAPSRRLEHRIEDPAHREHRGPDVDGRSPRRRIAPGLPARHRLSLDDHDRLATSRQLDRRRQAAEPGSDHDGRQPTHGRRMLSLFMSCP